MRDLRSELRSIVRRFDNKLDRYFGISIRSLRHKQRRRQFRIPKDAQVIQYGRWSAIFRSTLVDNFPAVIKRYDHTAAGRELFEGERLAHEIFGNSDIYPWKLPTLDVGDRTVTMLSVPESARLDIVAKSLSYEQRLGVAAAALYIVLDLTIARCAHRDFHSRNMWLLRDGDGSFQLLVGDFETMIQFANPVSFREAYDLTGTGLDSPFLTSNMCYTHKDDASLESVLGVTLSDATAALARDLYSELENVSRSFQTSLSVDGRRIATVDRPYASFEVPGFRVTPEQAHRNTEVRVRQLQIGSLDLVGSRILDLGCHSGAMAITLAQRGASHVHGVEFDDDKVRIARRVAAFGGVTNVSFQQGDIDLLTTESVGDGYDLVLCLAVEAHVKNRSNLFELLGNTCAGALIFETNGSSDLGPIMDGLRQVGFMEFRTLGRARDDRNPDAAPRAAFYATK